MWWISGKRVWLLGVVVDLFKLLIPLEDVFVRGEHGFSKSGFGGAGAPLVDEPIEFLNDFRLLGGEVGGFTDVVF